MAWTFYNASGEVMIEDGAMSIANNTNNYVVTATGADPASLNGEANLTFDGEHLTVSDGNLVIGTAGHGIDFSADGHTSATGAAMTSELLDGYEEGTWTPVLLDDTLGGSGTDESQTYSTKVGYYTRIGNWVHFVGWLTVTSYGTLTTGAAANIGGLPFASSSQASAQSATIVFGDGGGFALGTAGYSITGAVPVGGHDHFYLKLWDSSTGVTTMSIAEFDTPDCIFSGNYRL
jgi:hypothetical protein